MRNRERLEEMDRRLVGFDIMAEQFGHRGHGGFRAKRGQMEPTVLEVLLEGPKHGYEIIATIEEKSSGLWKPSAGSVYPTLELLTDKELVSVVEEDGKKVYSLTSDGKDEAKRAAKRLAPFWKRASKMSGKNIKEHAKLIQMIQLLKEIKRHGSETQIEKAHAEVKAFVHALEEILDDAEERGKKHDKED